MSDTRRCETCGREIPDDAPSGLCPDCLLRDGLEDPPGDRPPSPVELTGLLPHLEVEELVGQGGMGVVYRARQPALDRTVALKLLPPHVAAEPGFPERFRREAQAMARLTHPNIVAVHEAGEVAGTVYLVMEYVAGVNLRQALAAGRLTPEEALAIVPQICDALQYAHDQGVVHRDVKPENILLDLRGRVKIADFGLAKLVRRGPDGASLTAGGQVLGTWRYMAPEQIETPGDVDHRADIYSLGVVFYELLTGEVPAGRFEPPSHRAPVDAALDEVVLRALERERERRWQRAEEVKTGVESVRAGRVPPPGERSVPGRTSALAVLGILGLPLAIVLVLLVALLGEEPGAALGGAMAILLTGLVLSAAAWIRIGLSHGRVRGWELAAVGTFAPAVILAALIAMALQGVDEPPDRSPFPGLEAWTPEVSPEPAAEPPRMTPPRPEPPTEREATLAARSLLARLEEVTRRGPLGVAADAARDSRTVPLAEVASLVDPAARDVLLARTSAEWRRAREKESAGLLSVDFPTLARLREFHVSRVELVGERELALAVVYLVRGDRAVVFPIVRRDGSWYLAVGPVRRMPWEE